MANKIAYIVDSACFLNKQEVEEKGLFFLPLHLIIDGVDYKEGETLDKEELIKAIREKRNVTTSQPSPGEIIELINNLKKQGYDFGVFSSIGSGISKTYESMIMISQSENFKMYVLDSSSVGPAQIQPLLKLKQLVEKEKMDFEKAYQLIEKDIKNSNTLIVVEDLFHLSRGGRVSKSAAALGSMLKIKPILKLELDKGGLIEAVEKVRTQKKAYKRIVQLALDDYDLKDYKVLLANFEADDMIDEVRYYIEEYNDKIEIVEQDISAVVGIHTGLGCIGVQLFKDYKLEEE